MANGGDFQNSSFHNQNGTTPNECHFSFIPGVLLCVFGMLVSLAGFIGNFIVCLVFFTTKSLRTRSQFLILNLCVADLLTVLFALPIEIVWIMLRAVKKVCLSHGLMYARRLVISFSTAASMLILGLVSIERFIVIFWPMKHKDIVTTKRCTSLIAVCWIGCIVYGVLAGLEAHRTACSIFAVAATVNCFLVIVLCYSCIFYRMMYQNKVRVSLNVQQNQLHLLEKQMSKTIALIVFIYGLCYVPYTVARLMLQRKRHERDLFLILALSHSALDPVIYFYRSHEYKKAFRDILRKVFPRKNRVHIEPHKPNLSPHSTGSRNDHPLHNQKKKINEDIITQEVPDDARIQAVY